MKITSLIKHIYIKSSACHFLTIIFILLNACHKKSSKELIANISTGDEQLNLMKSVHRLCRYDQIPDIISLKNRVADKLIAENQYCF